MAMASGQDIAATSDRIRTLYTSLGHLFAHTLYTVDASFRAPCVAGSEGNSTLPESWHSAQPALQQARGAVAAVADAAADAGAAVEVEAQHSHAFARVRELSELLIAAGDAVATLVQAVHRACAHSADVRLLAMHTCNEHRRALLAETVFVQNLPTGQLVLESQPLFSDHAPVDLAMHLLRSPHQYCTQSPKVRFNLAFMCPCSCPNKRDRSIEVARSTHTDTHRHTHTHTRTHTHTHTHTD